MQEPKLGLFKTHNYCPLSLCNNVKYSLLTYCGSRNIIEPSCERSEPLMSIRRCDNMMMGMMRMMSMCMMMRAQNCSLAS